MLKIRVRKKQNQHQKSKASWFDRCSSQALKLVREKAAF
jgi:hypothetical protein